MLIGGIGMHFCNALKQLAQLSTCEQTLCHVSLLCKAPVDVADRLNQAYATMECATLHKLPQVVARTDHPVCKIFHGSFEVYQLLSCCDCEATMYSPDHSCKGWCEHSNTHGIDGMLTTTAGRHAACKSGLCIPDSKTMCLMM